MLTAAFEAILNQLTQACHRHYGPRLQALAVFGSVARGAMRPDSDIDLLLVVAGLPNGRMARMRDFAVVEAEMAETLQQVQSAGIHTALSTVFETPDFSLRHSLAAPMSDFGEIAMSEGDSTHIGIPL